jgi:hypothetical protein
MIFGRKIYLKGCMASPNSLDSKYNQIRKYRYNEKEAEF